MAARRRGDRETAGEVARPGRVVAHHGVAVLVRFDEGGVRQIWLTAEQRAVVGDRVEVAGERLSVLPAYGVLRRRDPRGRERTIAVNLDRLFIVVAAEPREQPGYIDRGIVIARAAGIEPGIVVNKLDLPAGPPLAARLAEIYGDSCAVIGVSAESRSGLEAIESALAPAAVGALVGPSGVGKSSLLNALVPDLLLTVSELNRGSGHGRHTTTTATLHTLAGGGTLVDTAGFKDFIAVDVEPIVAARCFPGFEGALEQGCRFRNCVHESEPGCAVLEAVAEGRIDERRLAAYSALRSELVASSSRSGEGGSRRPSR
jgi:ribosome biogenesis GTPase / thiamine phosphate phosphatase